MANKMNSTKVVTGVVRLSYANVWEPASINGSNPKYSVSLIIPKSDKQTLDAINAAVDAAIKEGVAKFGGKIPNKAALKLPLRDGDTERDDEAYECYRQKRNVSVSFLKKNHLDVTDICQTKSIPSWQLELMAKKVFEYAWKDQKDAVLLACKMLEDCNRQECRDKNTVSESLLKRSAILQKKQAGLREMCALGDISREVFLRDNQKIEAELVTLKAQLDDLEQTERSKNVSEIDIKAIQNTLNCWVDTSLSSIPEELIDEFVLQVVVIDDQTFNWTLDLTAPDSSQTRRMKPSEIALLQYREKQTGRDSQLDSRITNPQTLCSFSITAEEAEAL